MCHYLEFVCAGVGTPAYLDSADGDKGKWVHLPEVRSPCIFLNHRVQRRSSASGSTTGGNAEFFLMDRGPGTHEFDFVGLRATSTINTFDEITCSYLS